MLTLEGFNRGKAELVAADEKQWRADARVTRSKRNYNPVLEFREMKPLDWRDVRLPSIAHLRLVLNGSRYYTGAAAFVISHTTLLTLDICTRFVRVDEMTASSSTPQPCLS